jgi:hypothetical protein
MPTIEFTTFNEQTLRDTKPVLAKSVTPDWWKNMKFNEYTRGIMGTTIRACPAMDDWLKSGWYLCANRDMIVKNGHIDDNDDSQYVGSQEFGDGWETPSPHHPSWQMGYAFQYLPDDEAPVRSAFKFRNAWNITTPPGYSTMYLDPFLFQNKYFATWQGIIDTDKFNANYDNAQIIFYPRVSHSFVIKKGTPLVQVIPFKREEWNATYVVNGSEDWTKNRSYLTANEGRQKTMDEFARDPATSNEARSEEFALGGYRGGKLHTGKGKNFKEESPPPECPYHVSEDSPEIQLELPIGDKDGD